MQPADIAHLITLSSPSVSPDGSLVAYVLRRVDLDGNRYRSAIWLVPGDGSADPWQLSDGEHEDANPVWSPDGRRVAFTSRRGRDEKAKHSLHVLPVLIGGETVTLLERDESIGGVAWSPDGIQLAFASRVRGPRYADGDDDAARPPRRVDRLLPRIDSVGWIVDRPTQVFVLPADGSAPARQLTDGTHEWDEPTWAPDSRRLAATAATHPDADLGLRNDLWVLDAAAGSGPVRLTSTDASYSKPSWSPDAETIAVLREEIEVGYRHTQVALVDAGSQQLVIVSGDLDRQCGPHVGARPPVWHDGELLFPVEDAGAVHVYRRQADGRLDRLVGGDRTVTGFDARAGLVAFTATTATQPDELFCLHTGSERRLTWHQRAFRDACPAREPEHFEVVSEDGTLLDAWLLRPDQLDASVPVLVNVHGGPHTQYGHVYFDEFQMYSAAGFAVVYCNPHGSTGYSERFARAILSPKSPIDPGTGWGGIDYRDVLATTDEALRRYPFLDGDRVAIMGGSYGGFMASWAIGQTRRFAAACSERAVNNVLSLEWSSDVAGYLRYEMGVSHLDDPDELLRMSPITYVRDIETPVLILHSENDLRCHIEQADCLWVALRLLGKEVEYYRFPEESHELSRSGSPRHRVQRAELIIDWFRRKLAAAPPGANAAAGTRLPGPVCSERMR
jgi:dipeptidyl aminopeptidase/acylaminoacyl peptidase